MSQELDDLKSQLAAANARIAEMSAIPGDESIADSWAVVDLWEDRDWVPLRPQCADHLDALRVLARALTATRAAMNDEMANSIANAERAKKAEARAEALEKELDVVKKSASAKNHALVEMSIEAGTQQARAEAAESSLAAMNIERDKWMNLECTNQVFCPHIDLVRRVEKENADLRAAVERAREAIEWALERVPLHAKGFWWEDYRVHLLVVHRSLPAPSSEKRL